MSKDFRFYSTFYKGQLSIYEIAYRLTNAFRAFSKFDVRFKIINIHLSNNNLKIDLSEPDSVNNLAEAIIKYNIKDIQKYDKLVEPTTDYSREFGFSLGFNFETSNGDNLFSMNTLIGGDSISINYRMNETPIKQIEKFNIEWYYVFIKSIVKYLPIQFAVVRPRDVNYLDRIVSRFQYPIGLITYFNEGLGELLPKNIDILKYEKLENGMILIISEEIFDSQEGIDFIYKIMLEMSCNIL